MSNLAYLIGMFAGIVGICIAIYLEWITTRPCKAKYVYAYLILGISLVMVSAQDVLSPDLAWARTIGFSIILILEVYGFVYLYNRIRNPSLYGVQRPNKVYDR